MAILRRSAPQPPQFLIRYSVIILASASSIGAPKAWIILSTSTCQADALHKRGVHRHEIEAVAGAAIGFHAIEPGGALISGFLPGSASKNRLRARAHGQQRRKLRPALGQRRSAEPSRGSATPTRRRGFGHLSA